LTFAPPRIYSAVTERHTAFLLAGKYPDPGPSTWHPRFPLESLEELPLAPLPPRPNEEKLTGGTSSKELRAGVEVCNSSSINGSSFPLAYLVAQAKVSASKRALISLRNESI
jgi:hypothetical protein